MMAFRKMMAPRPIALAFLLLAACGSAPADPQPQLEALYDSDQRHRAEMQSVATSEGTSSLRFLTLWIRQEYQDWSNLRRLERIVAEHGWPRRSAVGDKAAAAAFLVIHHAGLERQKRYLPLVQAAVAAGEARAADLALLEDRILMREGRKQRYGSQLQDDGRGGWEFYPIEDEHTVDERRKAVGLPPLAEYAREFGLVYAPAGAALAQPGPVAH